MGAVTQSYCFTEDADQSYCFTAYVEQNYCSRASIEQNTICCEKVSIRIFRKNKVNTFCMSICTLGCNNNIDYEK